MRTFTQTLKFFFLACALVLATFPACGATLRGKVGIGAGKGSVYVEIYSKWWGFTPAKTSNTITSGSTYVDYDDVGLLNWAYCIFYATAADGYTFEAWYKNSACSSGKTTDNPKETGNATGARTDEYWAKFTPNKYTVTFDPQGGSVGTTTSTVTFDATYGAGTGGWPTPTRANYTFVGWYTYGGTKIESSTIYKQTQNQTLYAHWEQNYTIRFNGNGSTSGSMSNMSMTHGTAKSLTTNAFTRQYTVTYNVQGGVALSNTIVTYTFAGWATSATGSVAYTNGQSVDIAAEAGSIVDLYAVWTPATISITLPSTTKGTTNLEGWYLSGTKVGDAGDSYTPTSNVTLVANWDKFTPVITGSGDQTMKVDDERVGDFSFVHTDSPIAHISVTSISPINDGSGKVIEYDAVNNKIIARNAGVATIYFEQLETSTIKHKSFASYTYTVTKYDNALKTPFVTENSWTQTMTYNSGRTVRMESNNTISPIVVTQTGGDRVATYYDAYKAIYTSGLTGSATWSVSQAENYKYLAATTQTMTVNAIPDAESTSCYVLNVPSEHTFFTEFDYTGHFGAEDVYALAGPGDKLYFDARKDNAGFNYFVAQYSTDGGNRWEDLANPALEKNYQSFGPYELPTNATHIRFGAKVGGTLTKYYKNVRVTRRTVLTVDDVRVNRKSDGTPIYTGEDGSATLTIGYSIANGGDLHIANDNPSKFEISSSVIDIDDCSTGTATVTITYHAKESEQGNDTARFVIYNSVYSQEIMVVGVTLKHDQLGAWQNISMMTLGTDVSNAFTSTLSELNGVTYTIISGTAISILGGKLIASEVGTATIHAHVDGDATYNDIDSEITITVTEKMVQYIQWNQNLLHLHLGDPNVVLNATAQSDLECETNGVRPIVYTIKDGSSSVIQLIDGNQLKINGIGEVIVIASQAGGLDSDGHDYIAVSTEKRVIVRDPADKCEVNIFEQSSEAMYDMGASKFVLNDDAMEIDFEGLEPDSYTFDYKGASKPGEWYEFWTDYLEGTMTVEQFIDGEWWLIENLGTPTTTSQTASHALNHRATKMRIAISNARGYHYINNCVVKFARYLEAWEGGTEKYALSFNAPINSSDARIITYKYSNIAGPLVLTLSEGAPFILSQTEIDGDCGDHGSANIALTYAPKAVETNAVYTLTITDGEDLTTIITLTASAFVEECIFMETAADTDWQTETNWNEALMPTISRATTIEHDVVIDRLVSAYSINITKGAVVTIAPNGGLTVGAGGITGATTENLILQAGTSGTYKGQTGFVRISPDYTGAMPKATVQLYSIGYYDKSSADTDENNVAAWQYVGTPIDFKGALAKTVFTRSWIYSYDESSDSWVNNRAKLVMQPFVGYATTQYDSEDGKLLEYKGELIPNTGTHTINLEYSASNGYNVVANSFAAPIDITKMRNTDFVNVDDPTIYLFHTGTHKQAEDNWGTKGSSAGQFISIAIGTAAEMATLFAADDIPTTIAPMQGFGIYASGAGGQVNLDYSKLVWNANYAEHPNKPLRAPQLHEEETDAIEEVEITGALKMTISAEGRSDKCYLLESESYDALYEAGYDASKKMSGRLNVFTIAEDKQLAVNATNSIEGTRVGVRTGEETTYTFRFSHLQSDKDLVLWDKETKMKVFIDEDIEYTFYAVPNSEITERFQIVAANIPTITTGVDEIESETKVQKFIKDNQLYILKDGVLYNATGAVVRK